MRPPSGSQPGASAGPSPLLDVLGACWSLRAPVVGIAWDNDLAGFALGDGTLAMGRAEWQGAPSLAPVQGGTQLTPGLEPPPPVVRQHVHDGACLSVAALPGGGFLSGGDDGDLAATTRQGETADLQRHPGEWVDLVAAGADGWNAASTGRHVHLSGRFQQVLELPGSVTAMQFDAAGGRLAMAHYHGVTIWSPDAPLRRLTNAGCPLSLAWSPDGDAIVCGLQENALHAWLLSHEAAADGIEMGGYLGQPRSLAFSAGGQYLASSGSARVICWEFAPPVPGSMPLECGLPSSRLPVCQVACHPTYPLLAAGYHNGAVMLCRPGSEDVLFVRGADGGTVTALAWSRDGLRLAIGTQSGDAALVALPPVLFRLPETPQRASRIDTVRPVAARSQQGSVP